VKPQVLFFAGTMFWIRGAVLERVRRAGFTPADFDPVALAAVEGTLEHGFERVFGALVADCGYTVGGIREVPR
jgi:lipopolysaccharide biosynthesis protein